MPLPDTDRYTILTSKLGYGTYIPALILKKRLEAAGKICDLLIIEDYYEESKLKTFNATRDAFYLNPRLAAVASNINHSSRDLFLDTGIQKLLLNWTEGKRELFICFSGFWADIIERYNKINPVVLFCIIMDAAPSLVWQALLTSDISKSVFRFFEVEKSTINYTLNIAYKNMTDYQSRKMQVVIHGGGWGIIDGSWNNKFDADYKKIVLVNSLPVKPDPLLQYYINVQPASYTNDFPKFKYMVNGSEVVEQGLQYHSSLDVIGTCKAIISKPGGMTLLDSLITDTPVVFLSGIGKYEDANRKLWIEKGYGIDFTDWKDSGYSESLLISMNQKLILSKKGKTDLFNHLLQNIKIVN